MLSTSDIEDDPDFDEFQDASEIAPLPEGMTLEKGLEDAHLAVNYFFNNKFDDAKNLMAPWAKSSMYHAVGDSVFSFLEAMLTFEQQSIATAAERLKKTLAVCNRYRRKNTIGESLGKMVKKPNYEQYTEEEAHAELCFAECLLLKAMLTFMEDETLSSFIKAGIKIRSCNSSYKECQNILLNRNWTNSETKVHFESGVKMGIGAFNLMISMLPGRVVKILEFIGFSGNRQLGIKDLQEGYQMEGLRQILCIMTLLGYHLFVLFVLSHQEGDLEICEDILKSLMTKYPQGVWSLFFKGRYEFMKGNLDSSIEWYTKSWQSQDLWPQFHHLCYWELTWVNCLKNDWKQANIYATYLVEGSRWSRTIYSYQKAAILCLTDDKSEQMVDELMKDVPKYKQRIAGKSLPMEKFCVKRAERYFTQNRFLVLPVIELMYLWNLFKILKTKFSLAENIYKIIERAQIELNSRMHSSKYDADNRALILLLKGACLRQMKSPLQALECLETAISLQKQLQEDSFIIPYAIVELALLEWESGNKEKALLALEDAKKNYTGYSLESRLHFRIHTALQEVKA